MDGVIVVDKPAGWTSHDVVNRMRRLAGTRKVGHLGTLDPLATGVLPLVIGRATRLAQFFTRADKIYEATIRFGYSTDTYDREGVPTSPPVDVDVTADSLESMLAHFRGPQQQMPPAVSAKKIGGQPAYRLARKNLPVDLKPVSIEIFSVHIIEVTGAEAKIRIHCSSGTYVRSLAHELGGLKGCGAHLSELRRTASGGFHLDWAFTLERLGELAAAGTLRDAMIACADLLPEFPSQTVDHLTAGSIRQGKDFRVSPFRSTPGTKFVKAVSQEGDLVAIGQAVLPHLYHPILVI